MDDAAGQVVQFERMVAVAVAMTCRRYRSAGTGPSGRGRALGWSGVLSAARSRWARRWRDSDVVVGGDPAAQHALRFALYHLNGAANPHDDHVSIAARALTGPDYHGHVFWDTEIFLLPFYTLTWPEAARAMLIYRFNTLAGARAKAGHGMARRDVCLGVGRHGRGNLPGARASVPTAGSWPSCAGRRSCISARTWPMPSGTTGRRPGTTASCATPGPRSCWRPLASGRAARSSKPTDGTISRGVIGPDEYHETIDDNAFTNVMARWNIRRGLDVAALLRQRWPQRWAQPVEQLGLARRNCGSGPMCAETMATGLDPQTGLFEQFAGFFKLETIDLADYAGRSVPMDVVLGRERTQTAQVIKQADVVALLALLPEEFRGRALQPRTSPIMSRVAATAVRSARPCTAWPRPGWARPTWRCASSGRHRRPTWRTPMPRSTAASTSRLLAVSG